MAEPELSVMTRQCCADRVGSQELATERTEKWFQDRNQRQKGIDWQFTNEKPLDSNGMRFSLKYRTGSSGQSIREPA